MIDWWWVAGTRNRQNSIGNGHQVILEHLPGDGGEAHRTRQAEAGRKDCGTSRLRVRHPIQERTMTRPYYCERCGLQLRRCLQCHAWRCDCRMEANVPRHYDESGAPYLVQFVRERVREPMLPFGRR